MRPMGQQRVKSMGRATILKGCFPKAVAWECRAGRRWGQGGHWDPRASFHKRTHLTGQGTPGRWAGQALQQLSTVP